MSSIEIFILLIIVGSAIVGISYAYQMKKLRQAEADRRAQREADYQAKLARIRERDRQEEVGREKLRQHPNYGHPQFNPLNPDVLMPVYKSGPVSDTASMIAARKRVSNVPTSQKQYVGGNSVGIQSRNNVVYDDSTDLLNAIVLNQVSNSRDDEPSSKSSYISSYSDDDSSKRSSYSSSYSSDSSSDSSYSSSSSDSSSSWD